MTDIYGLIGSELRRLRKEHQMTQDDLAQQLSVSTNTVSRWETGHYKIRIDDLAALVGVFGLTLAQLFSGIETVSTTDEILPFESEAQS